HQWWDGRGVNPARLAELGFDPGSPVVQHWMRMVNTLVGFPRHLSQHTGGFVIARDRLDRLVPLENAALADARGSQWDKDDPGSPVVQHWMRMVNTLVGFPRHLSQHTGGFVIARDRLDRLVPIENAAMADRSVIQWDKDDLDALGLLKVDVLALGMLSAIRR